MKVYLCRLNSEHRIGLNVILLFFPLIITILCCGCFCNLNEIPLTSADGEFAIRGTVYEWDNAPDDAVSKIYFQNMDSTPENSSVLPLGGAVIRLGSKDQFTEEGEAAYTRQITTDANGLFDKTWAVTPHKTFVRISVIKDGYSEASLDVQHQGSSEHIFTVILVKNGDKE
jgi:hypothetical protein